MAVPMSARPLIHANAHTHTQFCDGESTAEEMVLQALSLNFTALGFSSHAPLCTENDWSMTPEAQEAYVHEVRRLQKAYDGKLTIYLGLEADAATPFGEDPLSLSGADRLDYLIGSVHMLEHERKWYAYDESPESFKKMLDEVYGGDAMRLCRTYFEQVIEMAHRLKPLILGHFDLVTKFNQHMRFFNEDDHRYQSMAVEALLEATAGGEITEINTGAMAREWKNHPYPAPFLLKELCDHHRPVMINSDCHFAPRLDYGFPIAVEEARMAGFTSVLALGENSLVEEIPLG